MKFLELILLTISCNINIGNSQLTNLWDIYVVGHSPPEFTYTSIPAGIYNVKIDNNSSELLYDANDVLYRYLGNSSSIFSTKFTLNSTLLEAPRLLLVFHGLDTFATIKLNGHSIGSTSNMFRRYVFDIQNYVHNSTVASNWLIVTFESAVKVSETIYNNHSENYIVYPKCVPATYNGECHVNHIRKMQASFGWDWGPAFPGTAIWRDVEIIPINQMTMIDHTIDIHKTNISDNWTVNVTVLIELAPNTSENPVSGTLQVILKTDGLDIVNSKKLCIDSGDKEYTTSVTLNVPQETVGLWWPNGYGPQMLYNLTTILITTNGNESRVKRIGFRTVELIQENLPKGLSFYFRINNIPIFAKGSNVIPVKVLPEFTNNATYVRGLLKSAKDVHMNMLRIWGGGVYESDYFYDTADEYGIMIWQDFMFACAMYPTTVEFLESVRVEIVQNVWRIKSHAAVVIWAGNNENEAALYGNWYGTGNEEIYRDDYIKLYIDVIKREVEQLDKYRPFVVSSPSNGRWADENGWIGTDPYSTLYGDIHYYNYVANGWDINTYPRPRFSSEYGIQSLPSIYNLQKVARNREDLTIDSSFINHRQHLPFGNFFMKTLIVKNFKIPTTNDTQRNFRNYIYLSQINQAQSLKVQTESYRQAKSNINAAGEGMTMGALYWQLNDVWQAPSWSSIDTDGRWKMLHYFAKDFFSPIIISPRLSVNNELTLLIISDELITRFNCSAEVRVHKVSNMINQTKSEALKIHNITVQANTAFELTTIKLDEVLLNASCGDDFAEAKKKCIIEITLSDTNASKIAPSNYVYPTALKNMELPVCGLDVSFDTSNSTGYRVTIESHCGPQFFVWFDSAESATGRFSENGFHLFERTKTIYYYPNQQDQSTFDVKSFEIVTLGQIYSTPAPSNIIHVDGI